MKINWLVSFSLLSFLSSCNVQNQSDAANADGGDKFVSSTDDLVASTKACKKFKHVL